MIFSLSSHATQTKGYLVLLICRDQNVTIAEILLH